MVGWLVYPEFEDVRTWKWVIDRMSTVYIYDYDSLRAGNDESSLISRPSNRLIVEYNSKPNIREVEDRRSLRFRVICVFSGQGKKEDFDGSELTPVV